MSSTPRSLPMDRCRNCGCGCSGPYAREQCVWRCPTRRRCRNPTCSCTPSPSRGLASLRLARPRWTPCPVVPRPPRRFRCSGMRVAPGSRSRRCRHCSERRGSGHVSIDEKPILRAVGPPESAPQGCQECGAPLDGRQRYCVSCGRRRSHADDPALRLLAAAGRRRRGVQRPGSSTEGPEHTRRTTSIGVAALIAVLPLVLGAGVLIGRSSAGGDARLIAALRAEKAPVIEYSGTPAAAAASQSGNLPVSSGSANSSPPTSTFPLTQGYAVELATLSSGATAADATAAEHEEKAKGAADVGVIDPQDFSLSPAPAAGDYVIYSGAFKTQAEAQAALLKLKHAFPKAIVIRVSPSGGAGGTVLGTSQYGIVHQVSGYKPTAAAEAQGAQIAQHDSRATGQQASGAG